MHSILTFLNSTINMISSINPAWYTIVAGPLASGAQHWIKKEHDYSKRANILIWLLLTAVGGAFYAVVRAQDVQQFINSFATMFPAIALAANLTYRAAFEKYEQLNSTAPDTTAPVVTAPVVPAGELSTPPTTPY